jgi:dolichol-phosphate mannosyltransferase
LPAYNEEANIGRLLEAIDEAMGDAKLPYEIVVVDDGSRDRTFNVLHEQSSRLPIVVARHDTNCGLGTTLLHGLSLASELAGERDIVITMDADATHTPGLILRMVQMVREGHDVVIASRYRPGARVFGVPAHRRLLSVGASVLFRIVFPTAGVKDFTCGYRAYKASFLKRALENYGGSLVQEDGFACMIDVLLKLRAMGAVFGEAPLLLRYDLKAGASKMRLLKTIHRTIAWHPEGALRATEQFGAAYYAAHYRNYSRQNPSRKLQFYRNVVGANTPNGRERRVLDLGCAFGSFLACLSKDWVRYGMDVSEYAVGVARTAHPDVHFVVGSGASVPLRGPFDAIVAFDVIEHIADLDHVSEFVKSQLSEDGVFSFVVPVYDGPLGGVVRRLDRDPTHIHKESRYFWLEWAERSFKVKSWYGMFRYLLPVGPYVHVPTTVFRSMAPAIMVVASAKAMRPASVRMDGSMGVTVPAAARETIRNELDVAVSGARVRPVRRQRA